MEIMQQSDIGDVRLPGRTLQKAIGPDSHSDSQRMTIGFASYSSESGTMTPHRHAEETVYIIESCKGSVRFGSAPDNLGTAQELTAGMLLHIPEGEWHVFEYGDGGFVRILFIYGQTNDIRPEDAHADVL